MTTSLENGLEAALFKRDIGTGFRLLDEAFPTDKASDAGPDVSISLLLCVAQWVDLGYRKLAFLEVIEAPHLDRDWASLPLVDYLKLRLVEGYRMLATERLDEAIDVLGVVLQIGYGILGHYLLFLGNLWKGRAHRKLGDYEHAANNFAAARQAAEQAGGAKLVAVTKIHESWLAFQCGRRQYAFDLLAEAERELLPTGHSLSLGNIESARGRFVRRSGDYAGALHHFESAMKRYQVGCPDHPNMARALVNAAYVKRLMALELRPRDGQANGIVHAKSLRMSREALSLLEEAARIYGCINISPGAAPYWLMQPTSTSNAVTSIRRRPRRSAPTTLPMTRAIKSLMARAKAVQSAVELARSEEQLGDEPNIGMHAHAAVDHAEAAIALALHTQNKRLLCEAYIARGLVAGSDFFQNWELAKEFVGKATALLTHDDRGPPLQAGRRAEV